MPVVNVDFYAPIDETGNPVDISAAVLAAAKLKPKERLKYRTSVYSDFLEGAKMLSDKTVLGSSARVRMKGLPGRFDSANYKLSHLDLIERDGVSEEVHFLIEPALQVIALQRNGHFRSTQVEALLSDLTGLKISLQPRVRADMWKRLQEFDHIGTFGFKLKDPSIHPDFAESLPSIGRTIEDAGKIGELASIEIIIKMRSGVANPQDVNLLKKVIRSFRESGNATKLYARGSNPEASKSEPLDFIRDRIVASGEVEYGDGRRLDGEQCKQLLRSALNTNRAFLETLVVKA